MPVSTRLASLSNQGPFAPITPLPRYYGPLRHPAGPGWSSRIPAGAPPTGLPVLPLFPSCTRCRQYPGGDARCSHRSLPGRCSPKYRRVGLRITFFEEFTRVALGAPKAPFAIGASTHVVTSMSRSDCFRLERQLAGRASHPLGASALARRTISTELDMFSQAEDCVLPSPASGEARSTSQFGQRLKASAGSGHTSDDRGLASRVIAYCEDSRHPDGSPFRAFPLRTQRESQCRQDLPRRARADLFLRQVSRSLGAVLFTGSRAEPAPRGRYRGIRATGGSKRRARDFRKVRSAQATPTQAGDRARRRSTMPGRVSSNDSTSPARVRLPSEKRNVDLA